MAEATKKPADPRTVQLKRVRLSFADSLKDKKPTVKDGVPKHSCNFILESDSPTYEENREKVKKALIAAGEQFNGQPELYKRIMEDDPKRLCYRKGERFKNTEGEVYKGYAGNWAISASGPGGNKNPRRPKLFDRSRKEVPESEILDVCYSGSYADVILSFYGTDTGGLSIFASIEAIRSLQEGERTGGGVYVDASDFDEVDDADDAFEGTSAAGLGVSSAADEDEI
mgnify:CR=1 FL=1